MRLIKPIAIGLIITAILSCLLLFKLYLTLPSHLEIKQAMQLQNLDVSSQVFDRTGKWIGKFSIKNRYLVSFDGIPKHLVYSFTSAEDKEFFYHFGINLVAIARAFYINLKRGKIVQGASTITQQLAKSFFLSNERTFSRKIKEALLAFKIENIFSKETILEIYLNKIFLGNHSYGVGAAAKSYFGKNIKQLNVGESALLAALPKAPSYFAPHKHYKRAIARQRKILKRMFTNGHLDKNKLEYWMKNPPNIIKSHDYSDEFGYYLDMVKSEVLKKFSFDKNKVNGLNIYSTLDSQFQKKVLNQIRSLELNLRSYSNPSKTGIELALVSINHNTGEIISISGGGKYSETQYNRALFTRRPIEQLVIPLALIYPLELGYQLDTPLSSHGETILSILNSRSIKNLDPLLRLTGITSLNEFLFKLGLPVLEHSFIKSLDKLRASPFQLSSTYASIFNGGRKVSPFTIKSIESVAKQIIYVKDQIPAPSVIKKESAYIMDYSLTALEGIKPLNKLKKNKLYFAISRNLRNAWIVAAKGSLTHILWLGGEYGKSNIAKNIKDAKNLLAEITRKILGVQGKRYQAIGKKDYDLSISFGRYNFRGKALTIPVTHF